MFYSLDRRYVNTKNEDEFLQALADGGFQVGELAKRMYAAEDPAAVEITVRERGRAGPTDDGAARREDVDVFEGTVRHGNLLVRVDVLRKRGNVVDLIEVKSKSFDRTERRPQFPGQARRDPLRRGCRTCRTWRSRPGCSGRRIRGSRSGRSCCWWIRPQTCSIDGLGTAIRVDRDADDRAVVTVEPGFDVRALRPPLLTQHDVSEYVEEILAGLVETPEGMFGFAEYAERMAAVIVAGRKVDPPVGRAVQEVRVLLRAGGAHCGRCAAVGRSAWRRGFRAREECRAPTTVFALYDDRKKKGSKLSRRASCCSRELDEGDVGDEESQRRDRAPHRHRLQIREARRRRRGDPAADEDACARRSTVGRFRCTSSTSRRRGRRCRSRPVGARTSSCCSSSRTT